jgi:hypothetical protein
VAHGVSPFSTVSFRPQDWSGFPNCVETADYSELLLAIIPSIVALGFRVRF